MTGKKVIIIGGTGFIGRPFVKKLFKKQFLEITVIHRNPVGSTFKVKGVIYKRINVAKDKERVKGLLKNCQYLIIFTPPNINALKNMLFDEQRHFKKILFASSILLYSSGLKKHTEDSEPAPLTDYEVRKFKEEKILQNFVKNKSVKLAIARIGNVYGTSEDKGFINIVFECMRDGKVVKINGNGNQKRDFIFIDDVVETLEFILNYKQEKRVEVFNVCSGTVTSLLQIIHLIERVAGKKIKYDITSRIKEKTVVLTSNRKITNLSHLKIKYDIENGLKKAYRNFIDA